MFPPVPPKNLPCLFPVHPAQERSGDHQQSGNPSRDVIDHIVCFRRGSSDIKIGFLFISKHRIHRVDRLVGKSKGRAADQQKQKRRDHAVGRILRDGLHRRLCHSLCIQTVRVPSHDHGNRLSRRRKILFFQFPTDFHTLCLKRSRRQDLIAPEAFQTKRKKRVDLRRQIQKPRRNCRGNKQDNHKNHTASDQQTPFGSVCDPPADLFTFCDQSADQTDRMIQPVRISQYKVQDTACQTDS